MSDNIIGSLNEHTLHLALKKFIEPDPSFHEVECGDFVADIKKGNKICEIETTSFTRMSKKLACFLADNEVTVVYPIALKRYVVWIDQANGEMSKPKISPKKGRPTDGCDELYKIRDYICHPNFTLRLIFTEEEHHKVRVGKRGSKRENRIPLSIISQKDYRRPEDYAALVDVIPEGIFTAKEFGEANRLKDRNLWYTIRVLISASVIEKCGNEGRTILYKRSDKLP